MTNARKVSTFPLANVRLAPETKDDLDALAASTGIPAWRHVQAAVAGYLLAAGELGAAPARRGGRRHAK